MDEVQSHECNNNIRAIYLANGMELDL